MRVAVIFGARPSAVKLAPVVHALQARHAAVDVLLTGQHGEMLDVCLGGLDLSPAHRFVAPEGPLSARLGAMVANLGSFFATACYEAIVVVGDTTSGLAGALAGTFAEIPVGHVEAGLRTRRRDPWPEEQNRRTITSLAHWHFAPTAIARDNLRREDVPRERIWLTGNPVVDSLRRAGIRRNRSPVEQILVTLHRRENWEQMPVLAGLVAELALRHPFAQFLWPVHPNPTVSGPAHHHCRRLPNVTLCRPLSYEQVLFVLGQSWLVITDSGGIQEEAATLGVPTLVVREVTERPEAVYAGVARLTGQLGFFQEAHQLLKHSGQLGAMERPTACFGDGRAGERIADIVLGGSTPLGEPG